MAPQEKKWDAVAERDLVIAVMLGIQEDGKTRYNWPRTHEIMLSRGYAFTKDAMSQHFTKSIMKEYKNRTTTAAVETATTTTSTPKKAGNPTPKATPTSRKRAKPKSLERLTIDDVLRDDEENDDDNPTPTKKTKKEGAAVKKEGTASLGHKRSSTILSNDEQFRIWAAEDAGK